MTVEPPLSRLQIAQQLTGHLGRRDFNEFVGLLAQDVTYRVGGNQALAGTFHGPDEVAAHVRDLVDRTGNTYDAVKWEDWLVGENHVAVLVQIHAQRHEANLTERLLVLLRFNSTDKVSEITVFFEDTSGIERFFGRTGTVE